MSLAKMSAIFARGQNPKWPPPQSRNGNFFTSAPKKMLEYTFSGNLTIRIANLTLFLHLDII